ncbi:enoyl-CoA hydratase-related protein [Proteiniborus sp. MB09-C3]|uniref:enoyl-CoA hydratase/isomerase family protein n=1 Tax=Proteiniborus sp. MB09-C3 TaxID=3050072 RepID=UPI002553E3A3|nr:enoyl-CoA hydratase-related protein [Proteiniborus sp. MB09-C3]WIV10419.1 enoyl-CoA hydratase-related protein [Proteiniborus sp. MB09-C3]
MVLTEKKGNIGIITFHRPEALNALNSKVIEALDEAVTSFESDEAIKVIVFMGSGRAFISGADISEMENLRGLDAVRFTTKGRDLFRKIEFMSKPTICAINGYAFGGGFEFALCTDIRIAGEKASFAFPEAGLGVIPGFSGTQRLPRLIGASKTKELMFTGRVIKADEALQLGIVNQVVPQDSLIDEVHSLAKQIAEKSTMAIEFIKKSINLGLEINIDSALEIETGFVTACFGSHDQIEGMSAFREKRKPKFD